MRTISATLLDAQIHGYPIPSGKTYGGFRPAIQCVFTSKDGETTFDASFDPTATDNRLLGIERTETPFGKDTDQIDSQAATIRLQDNDHGVPDILGYYVDLYYGLETSAGLEYTDEPCPRLWVGSVDHISAPGVKIVDLDLWDIWQILRAFPIAVGEAPYFMAEHSDPGDLPGSLFTDLTYYEILDYVISNHLTSILGVTCTLDDLGDQDDGIISTVVPDDPATGESSIYPNGGKVYQSCASFLADVMDHTNCRLRCRGNVDGDGTLHFQIVYPQEEDTVNETYATDGLDGEGKPCMLSYEAHDKYTVQMPNYIIGRGALNDYDGTWGAIGEAYDADDFTSPPTYNGPFLAIPRYFKEPGLPDNDAADSYAATLLNNASAQTRSGQVTVPHDARVELFDRVGVYDRR